MFVDKKTLVVVTGASRGIGRSICSAVGRDVGRESSFLLMARTASALEETRQHLLDAFPEKHFKIFVRTIDNASADFPTYKACFESTSNG
jgi:short-subunit dehydrogenase